MILLLRWILFALAISFVAWIIPGIEVEGFMSALLVCIIMALINTFISPLVHFITLPINILTLGIFGLIINALLFMLAGFLAPGFQVEGFWSALFGSIILSILSPVIYKVTIE